MINELFLAKARNPSQWIGVGAVIVPIFTTIKLLYTPNLFLMFFIGHVILQILIFSANFSYQPILIYDALFWDFPHWFILLIVLGVGIQILNYDYDKKIKLILLQIIGIVLAIGLQTWHQRMLRGKIQKKPDEGYYP
jgi:hypothetical protein